MFAQILAWLQKLVAADKTAIVGGVVAVLLILLAKFGLHPNASVMAYISAVVAGLLAAFTHIHFARKPAVVVQGEHAK